MQYFWMFLAALTAYTTGRGVIRWTLAAYFFGWMATCSSDLAKKRRKGSEKNRPY
jgi:hypothetical protein